MGQPAFTPLCPPERSKTRSEANRFTESRDLVFRVGRATAEGEGGPAGARGIPSLPLQSVLGTSSLSAARMGHPAAWIEMLSVGIG
jgi:hypothetical protein